MKIVCNKIGIKRNEASVYDKFISDIKFENNHYIVSLPFKENRPILLDNYQLS